MKKEIPVYQVTIPEYNIERLKKLHKKKIKDPSFGEKFEGDWHLRHIHDADKIGAKIDNCIRKYFLGKHVGIRVLGSNEHPGKSVNDLIKIIKKIGHDRYDPKRKGDRYENVQNRKIEIFAFDYVINKTDEYLKYYIEPFFCWCIEDRGYPTKIDIVIIYDMKQLEAVPHHYKGREHEEIKTDGFVFKNPERKSESVLAFIKVLS
ncbi:MAG: hypothetical protein AABW52_03320 [Nanoarchaeota archaeon]